MMEDRHFLPERDVWAQFSGRHGRSDLSIFREYFCDEPEHFLAETQMGIVFVKQGSGSSAAVAPGAMDAGGDGPAAGGALANGTAGGVGATRGVGRESITVFFMLNSVVVQSARAEDVRRSCEEHSSRRCIVISPGRRLDVRKVFAKAFAERLVPIQLETFTVMELMNNVTDHVLVPLHVPLSETQKQEVLDKFRITERQLPAIREDDVIARYFGLRVGNVVKIIRPSQSAGRYTTFRCCVQGDTSY